MRESVAGSGVGCIFDVSGVRIRLGEVVLHLFQLFPIRLTDKIGRAIDAAVMSRGGDELINVTIQESW